MIKKEDSEKKKKLTLSNNNSIKKTNDANSDTGSVRQSFSHGRSKTVTVEVKKRRAAGKNYPNQRMHSKRKFSLYTNKPNNITDEEWEKRLKVLQQAQKLKEFEKEKAREKSNARAELAEKQLNASKEEKNRIEVNKRLHLEKKQKIEKKQRIEKKQILDKKNKTVAQDEKDKKHFTKFSSTEKKLPKDQKKYQKRPVPTSETKHTKDNILVKNKDNDNLSIETEDNLIKKRQKKFLTVHKESNITSDNSKPKKKKVASTKGSEVKRRNTKFTLSQALNMKEEGETKRQRSLASIKRAREKQRLQEMGELSNKRRKIVKEVSVGESITIQELANRMAERSSKIIKSLANLNIVATNQQIIDSDTAEIIIHEFGHKIKKLEKSNISDIISGKDSDQTYDLHDRHPVITVMGHVDHGKTSLLDVLRKANIASTETGGITQHIGAYETTLSTGQKVTFLDTPGHAAFTKIRSRGANITDIVLIVIAADDGIMEQTVEAINHTLSAKVPMIIVINKIDRPNSNPEKIRTELLQHGVIVEEMGGSVLNVEISAKNNIGIQKLEEAITLQTEMLELKSPYMGLCKGTIIESKVVKGKGSVATVLIQKGTLRIGDIFVAGPCWGKVRALINDKNHALIEATPSMAIEVLGLEKTPQAGEQLFVVNNKIEAKEMCSYNEGKLKKSTLLKSISQRKEKFIINKTESNKKSLNLVIKADMQGSLEAISGSFKKFEDKEVTITIVHSSIGEINENDVSLATASNGLVVGFNVRANPQAIELAKKNSTDIRYYSIIYNLIDDMKLCLSGMLSPNIKETLLGYAKVQQIFNISKTGRIAGCMITEGVIKKGSGVRLLRNNIVIHEGKLRTLKRFKEEVNEVREPFECGVAFESYQDIHIHDKIECFDKEEIKRKII